MKNNQQTSGMAFDIVTPILQLMQEFLKMIFSLINNLGRAFISKILNKSSGISTIKRERMNCKKITKNENALGISCVSKKQILISKIDFSKHSFIVGASGFGKTNLISILQENCLKIKKAIIYFDPKGDKAALNTFKDLCQKYNRACYVFSEHHNESSFFNPVLEGTSNQIVDRIMRSFDWSEPFYRDESQRVLFRALKYLKERELHLSLKNIHQVIVEKFESKEVSGLLAKLENILFSDFGPLLGHEGNELTLSQVREKRDCLYIGLSAQGYGETAVAIGKLFLGELLYHSYLTLSKDNTEHFILENPLSVFFDEFGSLVTTGFIELQNKCRGAGMELYMAVQTSADIDMLSPDLTKQIIENSCNLFILKQRLDLSASFFSEAIGTSITKKQTYATDQGELDGKGTIREANELIVHPDIIKGLRIGQCVLLEQNPHRVDLINIRKRED